MKKITFALLLSGLMASHGVFATESLSVRVTGVIVPEACQPTAAGSNSAQLTVSVSCQQNKAVNLRALSVRPGETENYRLRPLANGQMKIENRQRSPLSGLTTLELYYL